MDTISKRRAENKESLLTHLKKVPIVQIACERAGVSRATFYRWCQEDEAFSETARTALFEGKAVVNDMAESQLISSIKDKSFPAISFWLKHNHPDYRTRVELTPPMPQEVLTPEQQTKVLTALQLITGNEAKSDDESRK